MQNCVHYYVLYDFKTKCHDGDYFEVRKLYKCSKCQQQIDFLALNNLDRDRLNKEGIKFVDSDEFNIQNKQQNKVLSWGFVWKATKRIVYFPFKLSIGILKGGYKVARWIYRKIKPISKQQNTSRVPIKRSNGSQIKRRTAKQQHNILRRSIGISSKGGVYIVKYGESRIKIGRSINVQKRLKQYRGYQHDGNDIQVLAIINTWYDRELEKYLHTYAENKGLNRCGRLEIFECSQQSEFVEQATKEAYKYLITLQKK